MTQENKDLLMRLLQQYKELGISDQIDFDKFYLYSIITHSTAIEGSTVTEVEAQLLFDEGITSSKRTMLEQQMNLDLKVAYDYGREWIRQHEPITTKTSAFSSIVWPVIIANTCRQISSNSSIQRLRKVDRKPQKWTEKVDRKLAMSF